MHDVPLTVITNDPHLIGFLDHLIDPNLDFSGEEYDEWYCISISPFKCVTCNELICYAVAGPHHIIIWPERDEDSILQLAQELKNDEDARYDPRIQRYNRIFGPCISWEEGVKLGWILN